MFLEEKNGDLLNLNSVSKIQKKDSDGFFRIVFVSHSVKSKWVYNNEKERDDTIEKIKTMLGDQLKIL